MYWTEYRRSSNSRTGVVVVAAAVYESIAKPGVSESSYGRQTVVRSFAADLFSFGVGFGDAVAVVGSDYVTWTYGDRLGAARDDWEDGVYSNDDDAVADAVDCQTVMHHIVQCWYRIVLPTGDLGWSSTWRRW